MDPQYLYVGVAFAAFLGILVLLFASRPSRLFAGSRGRLPKRFEVRDVPTGDIPTDA